MARFLVLSRHKDKTWPGLHAAIIDEDLWQAVQEKLKQASGRRRGGSASAQAAPLTGLLRDETGDRLTPSHAVKTGKRHRYYVSNRLISGGTDPTAWRLPAAQQERAVAGAIAAGSIRQGPLQIQLDPDGLAAMLGIDKEHIAPGLAGSPRRSVSGGAVSSYA